MRTKRGREEKERTTDMKLRMRELLYNRGIKNNKIFLFTFSTFIQMLINTFLSSTFF